MSCAVLHNIWYSVITPRLFSLQEHCQEKTDDLLLKKVIASLAMPLQAEKPWWLLSTVH